MSVRCNTDSVGVSWPEAKEQTGHRVTQLIIPSYFLIPYFPLVCSQIPLWICVGAEKESAQKGFKTSNEENSTIKGFLVFSGEVHGLHFVGTTLEVRSFTLIKSKRP